MKVIIKSIAVATEYKDSKLVDIPDQRKVEANVLDAYGLAATFRLPSIETDGFLVVGGIYELIFARRES